MKLPNFSPEAMKRCGRSHCPEAPTVEIERPSLPATSMTAVGPVVGCSYDVAHPPDKEPARANAGRHRKRDMFMLSNELAVVIGSGARARSWLSAQYQA